MPIRPLSKELQELAIADLNENPDRLQDDLNCIRKWAESKNHIRLREDDQWLVTFLRGCHFDLELAKEKLDLLYTIRPLAPEFLSNRDPFLPEMQELLKSGCCLPLPKTPGWVPVLLVRIDRFDATRFRFEEGIKMASMLLDIILDDDYTVINGAHMVVDTKGVSLQHILLLTPSNVRKAFKCFIEAYPTRPKSIHFINSIYIVHMAFNAFKYIFSNRILSMVYFYGKEGVDKFRELMPKSALPKDYGGDGPALEEVAAHWKQKTESYKDWYFEDEQYFSPKSKSLAKLKSSEESCCSERPFKKLEVD